MKQLSIFDLTGEFDKLLEQLKPYGIDDIYLNKIKGNWWTLSKIELYLDREKKYREYKQKMIELLLDFYKDSDDIDTIYYKEYDYLRINSGRTRSSYPVYCLEMINQKDRCKND